MTKAATTAKARKFLNSFAKHPGVAAVPDAPPLDWYAELAKLADDGPIEPYVLYAGAYRLVHMATPVMDEFKWKHASDEQRMRTVCFYRDKLVDMELQALAEHRAARAQQQRDEAMLADRLGAW